MKVLIFFVVLCLVVVYVGYYSKYYSGFSFLYFSYNYRFSYYYFRFIYRFSYYYLSFIYRFSYYYFSYYRRLYYLCKYEVFQINQVFFNNIIDVMVI